jgi:Phosphotransferase enzyme family
VRASKMVIFERVAAMFSPSDGRAANIVESDDDWNVDAAAIESSVPAVWGRPPLSSGAGARDAARFARRRAVALRSLRKLRGTGVQEVHRWPPPVLQTGGVKNASKGILLGGLVVELADEPYERVIDRVRARSGVILESAMVPSSGGSVRAFARAGSRVVLSAEAPPEESGRGLLRAGLQGSPADPSRGAAALQRLAHEGVKRVPRMMDAGVTAGAAWTFETLMQGRRPARLQRRAIEQLVDFCASLPRQDGPPTAFSEDLSTAAKHLVDRAEALHALLRRWETEAVSFGAIARHGDLWAGNLLVVGDDVSAVVDWDAWHPASLPGGDLFHLISSSLIAPGVSLGTRWAMRPWRLGEFTEITAPYWNRLGIQPSETQLEASALGWWACQVASSLERLPHLANDSRWVESNVDVVLERAVA